MTLNQIKKRVQELTDAVNEALGGARQGLQKTPNSKEREEYRKNVGLMQDALVELDRLEKDVDACLSSPSAPGCSCEELCERYRNIHERLRKEVTVPATFQAKGFGGCTC